MHLQLKIVIQTSQKANRRLLRCVGRWHHRKATVGALMCCLLSSCSRDPGTPTRYYRESHALLLATTQYKAWPRQDEAQADLDLVGQALKAQGFTLHVLMNPRSDSVTTQLRRFGDTYGQDPGNRLVVYVAGYGITHVSAAGRAQGQLAISDTPAQETLSSVSLASRPSGLVALTDSPAEEETAGRHWPRALSVNELDEWLKKLPARHSLLIVNSCFNGSVFQGLGDYPDELPDSVRAPVRHTLIAGDAYQCESAPRLFAQTLTEVMGSSATDLDRDGAISGSELIIRTRNLVMERSQGLLTPRGGKSMDARHSQGEMLFVRPAEKRASEATRS